MSVGYDEEIRPIVKASTASIGYVGLNEASEYLFGEPITKHQDFGLEVVQYLRDSVEREKSNREYLPALYSTPAEGLAYKWQMQNREQYGLIDKVTDDDYMTNSFHVHVKEDISPIEKAEFEKPFHAIATGGRISYAEFPNGVSFNVLKDCVDHAMDHGLYYGVNVVSSSCNQCAHQGDFLETCPKCHSEDITSVTRVCGYLSYSKVKGDTRYNPGKKAEILDRVKHVKEYGFNKREVMLYNGKTTRY